MAVADARLQRDRSGSRDGLAGTGRGVAGLAYSFAAFAGTWAFFTCLVLFLCNAPDRDAPWVTPSVDIGDALPLPWAVLVNAGLIALFGLQHSLMARPALKRYWSFVVPKGLERATYVHAANAAGFALMLLWQPIPVTLWDIEWKAAEVLLWALFALGWLTLFAAAFSFDVLELLGVRHAWAWYTGQRTPQPQLKTSWLYACIPHPMYVGLLLGVWATPHMTVGHALLAAGFTVYILVALGYEERDLARRFGGPYHRWRAASSLAVGMPAQAQDQDHANTGSLGMRCRDSSFDT